MLFGLCNLCRNLLDIARTVDWWGHTENRIAVVDRIVAGRTVVGHTLRRRSFDRTAVVHIRMAVRHIWVVHHIYVAPRLHSWCHKVVGLLNCLHWSHIPLVHYTRLVVRTVELGFHADWLSTVVHRLMVAALTQKTL